MVVANITKEGGTFSATIQVARTFFSRFKGLLGRKEMGEFEGLLLVPCKSVHTIGMRFAIDVVFIGKDGQVVGIIQNMLPYRLSKRFDQANMVLELEAGKAKKLGLKIGDMVIIE